MHRKTMAGASEHCPTAGPRLRDEGHPTSSWQGHFQEGAHSAGRNWNGDMGRWDVCECHFEWVPSCCLLTQCQVPGRRKTVITQFMSQQSDNIELCEKQTGQVHKKFLLLLSALWLGRQPSRPCWWPGQCYWCLEEWHLNTLPRALDLHQWHSPLQLLLLHMRSEQRKEISYMVLFLHVDFFLSLYLIPLLPLVSVFENQA